MEAKSDKEKNTILAALILGVSLTMTGCSEADKVNYNMSKQADYFECERKITVYNARTDKIIMEAEGYMSISNDSEMSWCVQLRQVQMNTERITYISMITQCMLLRI